MQGISGDGASTEPGRDHHKDAYTMWLPGGGIKPRITYGHTDNFGLGVVEDPMHVLASNLSATHNYGAEMSRTGPNEPSGGI